jgi:cytochrome c biogenesis protein ResB
LKSKRIILFRAGAILLLLIIAGIMMIIGRGHTVYIDNKSLEYNGQTYTTPYKVVVTVDGEQVAKLRDKERGMATCIGQKFTMDLEITQEKGGSEETQTVTVKLPYNMDGIAFNLPAYLAGLPEEVYLSEFKIETPESEEPSDEAPLDEFNLGDI